MSTDQRELLRTFRAALEQNAGTAHGPFQAGVTIERLVERAAELAGGRPVAVPMSDPDFSVTEVARQSQRRSIDVLTPSDTRWRERVASAAVGITGSIGAAADTGSVALVCGPRSPRGSSLLPDAHLCVVRTDHVYGSFEDAWAATLARVATAMVVWVSGPSRSADIEKRVTLGAHGPRLFEVFLIEP